MANKKEPFAWKDPKKIGSEEPIPGRCGVKLIGKGRKGRFCRGRPLKGKKRCRMHKNLEFEGRSKRRPFTEPRNRQKKVVSSNLYADGLLPNETEIYGTIKIGELDEELRVARIQLRRLWVAQKAYQEALLTTDFFNTEGGVIVELPFEDKSTVGEDGNVIPGKTVIKKVRRYDDYTLSINKTLDQISKIEIRRAELHKYAEPDLLDSPLMRLVDIIKKIRE